MTRTSKTKKQASYNLARQRATDQAIKQERIAMLQAELAALLA